MFGSYEIPVVLTMKNKIFGKFRRQGESSQVSNDNYVPKKPGKLKSFNRSLAMTV